MKVFTFKLLSFPALLILIQACGFGGNQGMDKEQRERDAAQRLQQEEIMVYEAMELIKSQGRAIARGEAVAPKPQAGYQPSGTEPSEPETTEPETTASGSSSPSGNFTIQVASLDSRAKANQELNKWEQRGFNDSFISEHSNTFRVRLGRYNSRQDAQDQARRVHEEYNISTWVDRMGGTAPSASSSSTAASGKYSIQVAAVASRSAADQQINSWKERGFAQAYAQEVQSGGSTLYRIRLGRFETASEAREVKNRIKDHYGTDSVIFDL